MTEKNVSIAEVGLTEVEGAPRCRDIELAERLGFDRPRDIRKLIQRNMAELSAFGTCATVAHVVRGNPATEFWLNEEQALLVSVLSDAPKAPAVRSMLIRVFVAWRRGHMAENGTVTGIDAATAKKLGGIFKAVVGLKVDEAVATLKREFDVAIAAIPAHIEAQVEARILQSRFGVTKDYVTAGEIADIGGVPSKGRRGLIRMISCRMRKYCARHGVMVREGILGAQSAYVFPIATSREWLAVEGHPIIRGHLDRHTSQGVLRLVQPKNGPLHFDGSCA